MIRVPQALLNLCNLLQRQAWKIQDVVAVWLRVVTAAQPWRQRLLTGATANAHETSQQFCDEIEVLFGEIAKPERLLALSRQLQCQFREALVTNPACMLPSFNHLLPGGTEEGRYLALDVGGSTFRAGLVELGGVRTGNGAEIEAEAEVGTAKIVALESFRIDDSVKSLSGHAFFDWIAARIEEVVAQHVDLTAGEILSMGLAWSFPVEQTSLKSGLIQGMGKGFQAAEGLIGHDLGDAVQAACDRRHLSVKLEAIVNDSSATLLAKAYNDSSTRFALILGTGVNIAAHLPVHVFGHVKFGDRPQSWHDLAKYVVVNTECSMFGDGCLPMTDWDYALDAAHAKPGFQPLEYLVGGRYIGEISRLVLQEASGSVGLFGGILPRGLHDPYSLSAETLAEMHSASSIDHARGILSSRHDIRGPVSDQDVEVIRHIAKWVIRRAAAVVAAAVHSLWQLREDAEGRNLEHMRSRMVIACHGSIIQSYPGFREKCQQDLDTLVTMCGGSSGLLKLEVAAESSLLGAAVAVACVEREQP